MTITTSSEGLLVPVSLSGRLDAAISGLVYGAVPPRRADTVRGRQPRA
ncbi:hypothetical protein [Micromonospora aurantiaca]|nr:hypothetical protein [Micromonospora aurantiaca]